MSRQHFAAVILLAVAACTIPASVNPTSPPAIVTGVPASAVAAASGSVASSPLPSLGSTVERASEAPAGAVPITMTLVPPADPRFQPDNVTAPAGTVGFYLYNVPAA